MNLNLIFPVLIALVVGTWVLSAVAQGDVCWVDPCEEQVTVYGYLDDRFAFKVQPDSNPNSLSVVDHNLFIDNETFRNNGVCDRLPCDQNIHYEIMGFRPYFDTNGLDEQLTLEPKETIYFAVVPDYRLGDPNSLYEFTCNLTQKGLDSAPEISNSTRTKNFLNDLCFQHTSVDFCCWDAIEIE